MYAERSSSQFRGCLVLLNFPLALNEDLIDIGKHTSTVQGSTLAQNSYVHRPQSGSMLWWLSHAQAHSPSCGGVSQALALVEAMAALTLEPHTEFDNTYFLDVLRGLTHTTLDSGLLEVFTGDFMKFADVRCVPAASGSWSPAAAVEDAAQNEGTFMWN